MTKQNVAAALQEARLSEQGMHHDGINVKEDKTQQHRQQSLRGVEQRRLGVLCGNVHVCSFSCGKNTPESPVKA